jgi:hypothetical protein
MALIVVCVIWENVTSLMRGASIWERWEETKYPESRAVSPVPQNGNEKEVA